MKADRGSKKLLSLQQASRHVNEMAANVVASTKTGQDQIEEKGTCACLSVLIKIYSAAKQYLQYTLLPQVFAHPFK